MQGKGERGNEFNLGIVVGSDFRDRSGRDERIEQLLALRPFFLFQHCCRPVLRELSKYIDGIYKVKGTKHGFG
jgi:hypothetical protein